MSDSQTVAAISAALSALALLVSISGGGAPAFAESWRPPTFVAAR